jgi:hypothetical protein
VGILSATPNETIDSDEQKNAPELPIWRFDKSKLLGGNRVILGVTRKRHAQTVSRLSRLHTNRTPVAALRSV